MDKINTCEKCGEEFIHFHACKHSVNTPVSSNEGLLPNKKIKEKKPEVELVCDYKTCNEPVWLYGLCKHHLACEWGS